jgi:hypothetical protein
MPKINTTLINVRTLTLHENLVWRLNAVNLYTTEGSRQSNQKAPTLSKRRRKLDHPGTVTTATFG